MAEQLSPLKRALLAIETLQERVRTLESAAHEPIAIVGIGCRLPGGAHSPEAFLDLLDEGRDAVVPLPRFPRPGFTAGAADSFPPAGYLEIDPGAFDAELFGVSPREAASIDPQQRIALECAWEALENAAIAPTRLKETKTGVFIGITGSDYAQLQVSAANKRELIHAHFASGIGLSMASGRISYLLGLQGPALSIDTACSSSLVAVHLACNSLRSGETDLALAGGTSVILSTELTVAFRQARMIAPDGRCKTFDASADGFGRGEGCGILVLKRLRDALRDRDPVWAVIRGSAVNQDGASSGLTAPNGPAQEAVLSAALDAAGLEPRDVGYVEAHGTGTELGDPIEVQALGAVYGRGRPPEFPLTIGTAKTNLGHLEGAAGVAGLIKAALAVHSGRLPKQLHFRTPNPLIAWEDLPVRVAAESASFPAAGDGRRRAGVSSFGFSGTNAHVILEQPEQTAPDAGAPRPVQVLPVSARNGAALRALAARYAARLERSPQLFADFCHTAATGRAHLRERFAIAAGSAEQTVAALRAFADGEPAAATTRAGRAPVDAPRPVFLFTGQGAQRVGMGRELYEQEPAFRDVLDRCAALLEAGEGINLLDVMFGRSAGAEAALTRTRLAQPALFALEVGLATMWQSWGVRPAMLLGHSVGEFAAAVVSGAISLEDGFKLIVARARLMDALPDGGAMAAVFAPPEALEPYLGESRGVEIAAINGAANVVISGDEDAVAAVVETLRGRGIESRPLRVSHAFHSRRMEPMLEELERVAASVAVAEPRIPVLSNLTGRPLTAAELREPGYWSRHARQPVRFFAALEHARSRGAEVFMECGPAPVLCGLGAQSFAGPGLHWIASLRPEQPDAAAVALATAAAYAAGVELDWSARDEGREARRIRIPTYEFQRDSLWVLIRPSGDGEASPARRPTGHALLGARQRTPEEGWRFEQVLTDRTVPFIADHTVRGQVIVPAAAYVESALAAASAGPGWRDVELVNLTIRRPLLLGDAGRAVTVTIAAPADGRARFTVHSVGADDEAFTLHVEGEIRPTAAPLGGRAPTLAQIEAACSRLVDASEFYRDLGARGLDFGPAFRGVHRAWIGDREAFGEIRLPAALEADAGAYRLHPALLDAGLQITAAALGGDSALYLPLMAGSVAIANGARPSLSHVKIERASNASGTLTAAITMYDAAGAEVVAIRDLLLKRAEGRFEKPTQADEQAVYEIVWEPAAARATAASTAKLELDDVARRLEAEAARLGQGPEIGNYDRLYEGLTRLATLYITRCLGTLGWSPVPGAPVSADALQRDLRVLPRHRRLLERMLAILVEDGVLERSGETLRVVTAPPGGDPAVLARDLQERFGDTPELDVTRRCGERLAQVLVGEEDPLAILFPGGDTSVLSRLYRDTPVARSANALLRTAAETAFAALPAGRALRVLEIGGGTGGTTAHVLPALPEERVEYTFTDVGAMFVSQAREEFGRRPGMRFMTYDVDQDPLSQGLREGEFDLVFASNVIHASKDVRATLRSIAKLLAPGGLLCAMEAVHPERWHDVTVGLLPGWWSFTDLDLRPHYALLDRSRWLEALAAAGFDASRIAPRPAGDSVLTRQAMLLARSGSAAASARVAPGADRWLVLGDTGGFGKRFSGTLERAGARVVLAEGDARPHGAAAVAAAVRRAFEASAALGASGPTDIVYLWALDTDAAPTPAALEEQLSTVCSGALQVLQRLGEAGASPPRLHVVTRAAAAVASAGVEHVDARHAALFGLARAVRAERPEIAVRVVDLPPVADEQTAERLLDALLNASAEPEVAIRGGDLFVPRLRARSLESASGDLPRRLTFGERGTFDELRFVPHPRRAPGDDEIEIEIEAAGLNFRDVMHALGVRYVGQILGGECVGTVVAAGSAVRHVTVGDRVMAAAGAFGDYITIHAGLAVRVPGRFSIAAAATLPIAFLTADYALSEIGRMRAGQSVLIHAAAGGVGMAALQLAKRAGLTVYATAGSAYKRALVRELGAAAVFDSRSTDFAERLLEATDGRGVDLVLNSLAGDFIPASLRVLAAGGQLLELGKTGIWDQVRVDGHPGLKPGVRYHAVDLSPLITGSPNVIRAWLERLVERFESGELTSLPHRVVPMSRAVDAFRDMAAGRHVGKLVLKRDRLIVRGDGAYLVTGGLGGIGLLVAETLARRGAGRLLLVGRSAPGEDAARAIERMQGAGTVVDVVLADVGVPADVERVFAALAGGLPLRGIVHSAGSLDDAMLPEQSWERFRRVFGAKVFGSEWLKRASSGAPLDFFVLFSSISSIFGSPGQANHSSANAYMNALAAELTANGRPALSIAWGAWSDVGAAARRGAVARVSQRGILHIEPERGIELFEALSGGSSGELIVSPMSWPEFFASRPRSEPMLEGFAPRVAEAASENVDSGGASGAAETIAAAVAAAPPRRKTQVLRKGVERCVTKVLGLPSGRSVDGRQPLGEIGLDSLLAVELRNALAGEIGQSLPATLMFDYPTVDALVEHLGSLLVGIAVPEPEEAEPVSEDTELAGALSVLDLVESLSDADVGRRVKGRIDVEE